jgi:hypothetical protein
MPYYAVLSICTSVDVKIVIVTKAVLDNREV